MVDLKEGFAFLHALTGLPVQHNAHAVIYLVLLAAPAPAESPGGPPYGQGVQAGEHSRCRGLHNVPVRGKLEAVDLSRVTALRLDPAFEPLQRPAVPQQILQPVTIPWYAGRFQHLLSQEYAQLLQVVRAL